MAVPPRLPRVVRRVSLPLLEGFVKGEHQGTRKKLTEKCPSISEKAPADSFASTLLEYTNNKAQTMSVVEQVTPEKPNDPAMDSESSPVAPNAPHKRKPDGARNLFDPNDMPTCNIKEMLQQEANKMPKVQKENSENFENNEEHTRDASPLKDAIYDRVVHTEKELDAQRANRADRAMKQVCELGTKLSEEEYEKLAGSDEGFELLPSA